MSLIAQSISFSEDMEQQHGDLVTVYREHRGIVYTLAWLSDGEHIISGGDDKEVHVWDSRTAKTILRYSGHTGIVTDVAVSPTTNTLAASSDTGTQAVHVWDTTSGHVVCMYRLHRESVQSIAWSPDGRLIASASNDHSVHIWSVLDGKRLFTYLGHTAGVWAIAWSPNGQFIASADRDTTVQIWHAP